MSEPAQLGVSHSSYIRNSFWEVIFLKFGLVLCQSALNESALEYLLKVWVPESQGRWDQGVWKCS